MTTKAYVLIETSAGKSRDVASALRVIPGIKGVDLIIGPHDIIAWVEVEDLHAVGSMVTGQIHPIPNIVRTVTCLSMAAET